MEVVDLEKKAVQDTMEECENYDTNYDTAELDVNGELTQDPETVDQFRQNHWQFSDEGRGVKKCFLERFAQGLQHIFIYDQPTACPNRNN